MDIRNLYWEGDETLKQVAPSRSDFEQLGLLGGVFVYSRGLELDGFEGPFQTILGLCTDDSIQWKA